MANRAKELALAVLIKAKDEASAVFGGVAGKVTALFTALSAFLGFKFLTSAIGEAGDFEKAMARVIAKTDDGQESAADLKKAAETIGPAYNTGAAEAAQGLEILGAAGLKAKDAIALLPTVLALAKAEDIGLEQATQLLVGTVTGLGQSFSDTAHDADVMVAASKASTGSAAEMGETMKYAAANARALGIDIDTLGALTATLANNSIKGEQAGTGLRQTFAQMLDPTSTLRKALAGLGDTSGDFNKALATLAAAGPRGEAAIAGLDVEVSTIVRNLLGSGIPTIQGLAEQFKNATGAAQDTAKTMQDNLPSALSGLGVAWDLLRKYLVEPLLGPIKQQVLDLTQALKTAISDGSLDGFRTSLVDAFTKGAEAVKQFIAGLDLQQVLKNLQDFAAGAVTAFQTIGDLGSKAAAAIQAAWNGAMLTVSTMAAGIGNLIAGIKDGFASIADYMEKIGAAAAGEAAKLRSEAESWRAWAIDWAGSGVKAFDATTAALDRLTGSSSAAGTAQEGLAGSAKTANETLTIEVTAAQNAATAATGLKSALDGANQAHQGAATAAAASAEKLKELKQTYEDLKASGTATPQQLAAALNDYLQAMKATTAGAQNMEKEVIAAYQRMGIQSSDTLKTLADQSVRDFNTIRQSGAAVGDVNAAFAAMAESVMKAGQALGPMGEELAIWKLKAIAATEEQQKALDSLIQKYSDSGQAAVTASNQQITAANNAATAIEAYSNRVEARAGAGALAFQETTNAINQQTTALNRLNDSQTRQIEGYSDLTEAGKARADALLKEAIAADARQAGMLTYRDETGRTIRELDALIASEDSAAKQVEALKQKFDDGQISAASLKFQLNQLALQLRDPMTQAGATAVDSIQQLLDELKNLSQSYNDTANAAQSSYDAQVSAAQRAQESMNRIRSPTLNAGAGDRVGVPPGETGATSPVKTVGESANSPTPSRTVRVVFALPSGDVPVVTDELSAQRLIRGLESAKLRAS